MENSTNQNKQDYIDLSTFQPKSAKRFKSSFLQQYGVFSDKLKVILDHLEQMKFSPHIPLLITGDTGSGKELIAQFMHYEVDQSQGKYLAINCSNINKELFESELFGYEKGAFTGANQKGKEGYLEQAENGTLFLDEITEIGPDIQAKLLRVLETGEYYKVGGRKKITINARLVFASNRNLMELVSKGKFREDLYYRLNIVHAKMPPLHERKDEIIPLMILFINQLNQQLNKSVSYIEPQVLKLLEAYKWPGNIRELKNFITQIMIFLEGNTIKFEHLQMKDELDRYYTQTQDPINEKSIKSEEDLIEKLLEEPLNLEDLTFKIVKRALQKFNGNKAKTARFLGLKREQLYNRYKID